MKKILIIFIAVFTLSSCEKDLTSLNTDKKNPTVVAAEPLFASAQRNLADILATPNVNSGIFRLLAQQWTETTYFDESRYDLNTRNIPQNFYAGVYRDVLRDLKEAKTLIPNNINTSADEKANQLAIADIMQVYAYSLLVNTFGDIPYTEALDFSNSFPKFDDARTIHLDLLTRLDADIAALKLNAGSYGGSDNIYQGDPAKWRIFAYTLKLKLGMMLADADPAGLAAAKAAAESSAPNVFTSNANNAVFKYYSASPNTNPVWVNLVQSGRKDFVAANTIVDKMNALADPRISIYFTTTDAGNYVGGIYGTSNNYAAYSKPGDLLIDPAREYLFLDYAETEFLLAEAVERGFAVGGTAADHYNKAVTASIEYWGGTTAQATAYLANPAVNYATATGTYRQKIGEQKWIALYDRGFDAWTEWRRLDYPIFNVPPGAPVLTYADIPVRFTYPVNEQNLNKTNYEAASSAIGGDKVQTKLFWDKF
ncbi:SusD/RagB family nutrient-binding outer membrane lipoprotein [Daejeonella oryzae]|uniref:SusD/RagB family nutrient-binding outer membrane lipoprotein n=1 Tax=Daejeonella oryzae TaxID=1122943 RepID=UPI0003FD9F7F|nr:SusD/RagB family nutrient-binding outer membrane lipoprotein [Daejeonella oryzae]